jgi:hypothetical protein
MIIGVVLLANSWSHGLVHYAICSTSVDVGETLDYALFMSPVGLGNIMLGYSRGPGMGSFSSDLPIQIPDEVVLPVHLMVVSPSNVTLVDVAVVTPCFVPVDFAERGEYLIYVTNMGDDECRLFPVGLNFPYEGGVTYREADKFFVSLILTVSGAVLFCVGFSVSLILKYKKLMKKQLT